MPVNELKAMLSKVHAELEKTEDLPNEEERSLRALLEDIEDRLDELEHRGDDDAPLGDRVSQALGAFQVSHPTLAFTLRRLVDTLHKVGI